MTGARPAASASAFVQHDEISATTPPRLDRRDWPKETVVAQVFWEAGMERSPCMGASMSSTNFQQQSAFFLSYPFVPDREGDVPRQITGYPQDLIAFSFAATTPMTFPFPSSSGPPLFPACTGVVI
jgi:hypothetical protein